MKITNIVLIFVVIFAIVVYKANSDKQNSTNYTNFNTQNSDLGDKIELNLDSGEKIWLRKSSYGFDMQNNSRPTLFIFFTTWCPTCKNNIPFYLNLQKQCPNLRLIGALLENKDEKTVKKYKKTFGITYEIIKSGATSLSKAARKTNFVPSLLLLDKNGVLIHEGTVNSNNIQNFINLILNLSKQNQC